MLTRGYHAVLSLGRICGGQVSFGTGARNQDLAQLVVPIESIAALFFGFLS
jgi:hypothetical protein